MCPVASFASPLVVQPMRLFIRATLARLVCNKLKSKLNHPVCAVLHDSSENSIDFTWRKAYSGKVSGQKYDKVMLYRERRYAFGEVYID